MGDKKDNAAVEQRWSVNAFSEEDRIADTRPICRRCEGRGMLREWSTPFFVIAVIGLVGAVACLYKLVTAGSEEGGRYGLGLFLTACVFVFGAFPLVDKSECRTCGGMGRFDVEEADEYDEEDDEQGGEWADHPLPE